MLKNEAGGNRVAAVIDDARMSVVNLAEVVGHLVHNGMPRDEVDAVLRPLPITFVPADVDLSRLAGGLRGITAKAGLSLGDRFCLAFALTENLPAWTADRAWNAVADELGVEVVAIR
jgi:ribonuclease VapC